MLHVVQAEYLDGFRVRLTFSDGHTGVADLAGRLTGPVFLPLNVAAEFCRFSLEGNTLSWPNGADLAPEYLRELAISPADGCPRVPDSSSPSTSGGKPVE